MLSLFSPLAVEAQSFEQGLEYYQQKQYEKAVSIFNGLNNAQGYLFTAKSFYALGNYDQAQSNLNSISEGAPPQIYFEAMYTSALVDFQRKLFADALDKLHQVAAQNLDSNLTFKAKDLYQQILNYLTANQRRESIDALSSDEIKFDLLESGMGNVSYSQAQDLYSVFEDNVDDDEWTDRAQQFESTLRSASAYRNEYGTAPGKLQPPRGTTYTLGVALPEYKPSAREFEIVKAIYFGALLAAEDFNEESNSTKAFIRFSDTGTSSSSLQSMMQQFVNQQHGDAVVGPLFSKQAEPLVSIATNLRTPTVAPLANSPLNVENSYLFQANPTFTVHGRQMAQYAVNVLGHKNFAIIASRNTNGAQSAQAFREEVQRLGANVIHYNIENLESNEYEISRYTRRFGSDEPIDAIYAPFTGRQALNLIDLLLIDLRDMTTSPVILGSQEYQNLDLKAAKYRGFDILFSSSSHQANRGANTYRFKNTYQQKFGSTGNQYAMVGYDVTRFLLQTLQQVGNPALLRDALANHPTYQGMLRDINFNGGNVNEAVKIFEVTSSGDVREQN